MVAGKKIAIGFHFNNLVFGKTNSSFQKNIVVDPEAWVKEKKEYILFEITGFSSYIDPLVAGKGSRGKERKKITRR